jgi:lysylphosphatidylglycerol synthetase-like protein (DUF2156 family)
MMDRYSDFKAVAATLRIFAYIVAAVAGISAVIALFTQPGFGAKMSAFVWRIVWSALGFSMCLGASETVYVLLEIVENTGRMVEALDKKVDLS